MLKRIPKMLLLVALLTKRPGFEGLKNVQVLSLGRQTTSAASRMSLRPKNFPVRQNQLPRDLLLVIAVFSPRLYRHRISHSRSALGWLTRWMLRQLTGLVHFLFGECPAGNAPPCWRVPQRHGERRGLLNGLSMLLEGVDHGSHKIGSIAR